MLGKKELVRRTESTVAPAWRPFKEMQELRNWMSNAFEELFSGDGRELSLDLLGGRAWSPAVDVEETDKEYVFSVELPGLEKDDFKVEMQNGCLIISGERKEKKEERGKNLLRHEQYYGAFRRMFSMPDDANPENIKAAYKNGILSITVQRSEKAKPKAIPVIAQ